MAEERTIGSGKDFSTRTACKDDINTDHSGDITGQGIQTCKVYTGGSNDVYNEKVDWSGITCTSSDYIIMQNENSFIRSGIATFRHGTVFETTSTSYCVRMAEYMILDGFSIVQKHGQTWGYGTVTLNNYSVLKNCFVSAHGHDPSAWAAAIGFENKTGIVLANVVVLQVTGGSYSFGIFCYRTAGEHTINIYHTDVFDMFGIHVTSGSLYVRGGSSLHVNVYNSFLEDAKGVAGRSVYKYDAVDLDMYNCAVEDTYVYGGSGNLTNKKVWKDCFLTARTPFIWDPSSVLVDAGYNLNSDPNKAHFQYDINRVLRDLTKPSIGAGGLKDIVPATPQVPVITTSPGSTTEKTLDIEGTCQTDLCYIKIYIGGINSGQGVLVHAGTTTWKVENVGLTLGANIITASSLSPAGAESAESSSITITRNPAPEPNEVETIDVTVEDDTINVVVT